MDQLEESGTNYYYSNTKSSHYRPVYCANCGEEGHYVRDCINPITSFGIVAFKIVQGPDHEVGDLNDELRGILNSLNIKTKDLQYPKIKFLLIQRKDTMGYIDLLRGKYPIEMMKYNDISKDMMLKIFVGETTPSERENLLTKSFEEMWDDLWVNKESRTYKNEREYAKKHFKEKLPLICEYIKEYPSKWDYSEFSFPKGRKLLKEINIKCAKREFKEETGYTDSQYTIIKGKTFNETFVGTNMVKYTHIYYLGHMPCDIPVPQVDMTNEIQMGEVKNIGWFTVDEAFELMRDYDVKKKKVLLEVYEYLIKKNFSNFLNLT